jgi:hypothetical protein
MLGQRIAATPDEVHAREDGLVTVASSSGQVPLVVPSYVIDKPERFRKSRYSAHSQRVSNSRTRNGAFAKNIPNNLLVTQCCHGIERGGATRRKVTGEGCYDRKEREDRGKGSRVGGCDSKQEARNDAGQG